MEHITRSITSCDRLVIDRPGLTIWSSAGFVGTSHGGFDLHVISDAIPYTPEMFDETIPGSLTVAVEFGGSPLTVPGVGHISAHARGQVVATLNVRWQDERPLEAWHVHWPDQAVHVAVRLSEEERAEFIRTRSSLPTIQVAPPEP